MKFKIFLFSYFRSIIIFLLILIASTIPASEVQKVKWISIPNFDKIVHLSMYFFFSFILIYDISRARLHFTTFKIYLISALIALSYGGILEICQGLLTKSRTADLFDFISNTTGVLLAVLLWVIIKKLKKIA